jgi:hypothetical protein
MDRPHSSSIEYLPNETVHLTFDGIVSRKVAHAVTGMIVSDDLPRSKKSTGKPIPKATKRQTKTPS